MLTGNKLYYGLILVPFACFTQELGLDDAQTFILAAAAILPLAGLLGEATEQVAFHTNETVGGLLNATFGNATELIVCYFALQRGLLLVVQVSLLGSILSNTLLVLGCSMVAAGIRQMQSKFNLVAAQSNTTLLQIAILGLVVPTAMESTGQFAEHSPNDLTLARGISIVLLILYVLYVYFQARPSILPRPAPSPTNPPARPSLVAQLFSHAALGAIAWLAFATVLIAFLSEKLTGAIEGTTATYGISETFVSFVIIPIVGNAAEHSTAIVMAWKGKMDLAFGVALGSSTQIALFVVPLMVIIGWAIDQPLTLVFGVYETIITFLSVLIVSHIVSDGETNWLEGTMLLFTYFIICFAFFFYHHQEALPDDHPMKHA
ncbi:H+/Ca2+ exchanger [Emiliania huxleyi CCMP1516]|uniref:Sodium/calcium exchanger membrane region domain-containing protein n=2 Tax=Emiliania huxleyi TaxID=2903 RepID=A0A0D3IS50_EMIH1|nr:H+/Ca2+ exchanger [Emiliania huxleyi CCMP1516]EOD14085.1 H+/Ca2+ exchanger [Emiliania huxleyi CCMP1516]|eukprot:XP_005766514.1 H+/Ca2+ exchanger [Emiliania huxleyi CCMP1516]